MDALIEQTKQAALAFGPNVVGALAILIIGWIASRTLKSLTRRLMLKAKVEQGLAGFASSLAHMAILALVVVAALDRLGVETTSFAAILAAAGLAIGFALQGSLSNFASGVMILFFRPFKVGDYVEAAGVAGSIEEIQIFATQLKTPDNKSVIVPNSSITGGNITNYSAKEERRVDLVFGIGYDDDIKRAKETLQRIVSDHDKVLSDPAPVVAVLELADSSVNFAVRPWVKTADYWDVYFDVTEAVKLEFDSLGISIPFPQTDVHIHNSAA